MGLSGFLLFVSLNFTLSYYCCLPLRIIVDLPLRIVFLLLLVPHELDSSLSHDLNSHTPGIRMLHYSLTSLSVLTHPHIVGCFTTVVVLLLQSHIYWFLFYYSPTSLGVLATMLSTACTGPFSSSHMALYTSLCRARVFLPSNCSDTTSTWIYGCGGRGCGVGGVG
jgi:hypothetical protein